jgi:eukaryotic-like serine/threonine-protein kinase
MPSDRPSRPSTRPSMSKQPVDPMIGRVLADKFKIVSLLARGGMGKVYKAEQAPLGRACAVKVLTPPENGATSEDEFRKRFFLEASIGAKLTHPNTVTIFDYGVTDDGVYFIAMEYLEGKTLARVLKEEGPFNEERAAHIARQICRSLREAHAHGVIHRDLKPANVYLVSHADESDVVKVLDFGLVKNVESDGEDLTQTGLFMGSPKYMAPEQIRGEHVDGRTDVYALGVILYEMMTGKVPYDKPKQVDTLLAHVNDALPAMRDKKPDLDIGEILETVILRCLAKNPDERYAGMAEVLEQLKGTAGGNATMTRTAELESLRASGSFTPAPSTYRPNMSGEIPAANPMSIAPATASPPASKKWVPIAIAAAALVAIGVVLGTRKTEQPAAAAQPEPPKVTQPAATPTPTPVVEPAKTVTAPVTVVLDSEPANARVRDESHSLLCDKTPCKLNIEPGGLVVVVEHDGYGDQKVKISPNDPPRMIKLTKNAAAAKPAQPAAAAKPPPATTTTIFKPDPYANGPY